MLRLKTGSALALAQPVPDKGNLAMVAVFQSGRRLNTLAVFEIVSIVSLSKTYKLNAGVYNPAGLTDKETRRL